MNITVTASDGHQIRTTKGRRNMDLLEYICANLPSDREAISKARAEIRELRRRSSEIRREILESTGYQMPVF